MSSILAAGLAAALLGAIYVSNRRQATKLAATYRELQQLMSRELTFATPEARHAGEFAALGELPPSARLLGDTVESIGALEYPVRVGVDDAGMTLVLHMKDGLWLCSFGDEVLITEASSNRYPLASPPFVHRLHVPRNASADALLSHHERIARMPKLRPIASLEDAQLELSRLHSLDMAWRESQDVEDLIEADLRALLGPRYEVIGHAVGRRVLPAVPHAKVVR